MFYNSSKTEGLPLTAISQEKLAEIRRRHPKWQAPKYPGMTHWIESGWVGNKTSAIDVKALDPQQVPDAIVNFQPTWDKSLRDLCEATGVAIARDPIWGTAVLDHLRERLDALPEDSLNPILWGIRGPVNDGSAKLDTQSVIALLGAIRRLIEKRPQPAAWSSLPSVLNDLTKKFSLSISDWHELGLYLEAMFRDYDYKRTEEERPIEWLQRAVNHPYGDLAQAYRDLAQQYVDRLSKDEKSLSFEPHSEAFFDRTTRYYGAGSRYGLCLLTERMSWMEAVSPEFADRMKPLFDWTENSERAQVAWSGYLWSRTLSRVLVENFAVTYINTIKRHAEFGSWELEGLASHTAAVFWLKLSGLDSLYRVAEAGNSGFRLSLLRDWKSHLSTARPDNADEFFRTILFPYWDWCARQSFFAKGTGDNERFGFWELLPYANSSFPEASRRAVQYRPLKHETFGMFVEEIVKDTALKYPDDLLDLLIVLLEMDAHTYLQKKEWQAAWEALKGTGSGKLDILANVLARRDISLDT